jgi:endogenous inhibitor of DNA gyrase (YacG/DUF329 family)
MRENMRGKVITIECPKCRKQIREYATVCIHCAYRLEKPPIDPFMMEKVKFFQRMAASSLTAECPNCGREVNSHSANCKYCRFRLQDPE